ncbi:hypothetical protein AVEN_32535-1 [Araneus ventricosus]|uniref:Uncharacterized protein n=1 Tax=Araneus ventricosus TaxID=182803 RepID=A0A4Y2JHA8_ARAVE|nr:hypothetical protein AVEN_32535-1 [Araneus ventricosus]
MMNGRETDLEVGGSIVISNTEETVTESREDSIAKEKSALEKTSRRRAVKKTVVWKTFKSIVFLICLIFLIIQSVEFFNVYYKYPTTIVTEVTVAKEFKLPAITFCFRNTYAYKARTIIENYMDNIPYLKCYSDNLHLYQRSWEPKTLELDFDNKDRDWIFQTSMDQMNIVPFYPPDDPQIFFAIHSPAMDEKFEKLFAMNTEMKAGLEDKMEAGQEEMKVGQEEIKVRQEEMKVRQEEMKVRQEEMKVRQEEM